MNVPEPIITYNSPAENLVQLKDEFNNQLVNVYVSMDDFNKSVFYEHSTGSVYDLKYKDTSLLATSIFNNLVQQNTQAVSQAFTENKIEINNTTNIQNIVQNIINPPAGTTVDVDSIAAKFVTLTTNYANLSNNYNTLMIELSQNTTKDQIDSMNSANGIFTNTQAITNLNITVAGLTNSLGTTNALANTNNNLIKNLSVQLANDETLIQNNAMNILNNSNSITNLLQNSLPNLQSQITGNDSRITTVIGTSIPNLQVASNESANKIVGLQTQITNNLNNINTNATNLQNSINGNSSAITSIQSSVTSLNAAVVTNQSSITTTNGNLSTANTNIANNTATINSLTTNLSTLSASTTSSLNTINGTLTSHTSQINTNNSSITSLQNTTNTNSTNITSLQNSSNTNSANITALQNTVNTLQTNLNVTLSMLVAAGLLTSSTTGSVTTYSAVAAGNALVPHVTTINTVVKGNAKIYNDNTLLGTRMVLVTY